MNRNDLIRTVTEDTGLTVADAQSAIDATLTAITAGLAAGEKVTLPSFGTFETRERAARAGRNPQTGAEIQIAATTVPAFKPAAQLKRAVADG